MDTYERNDAKRQCPRTIITGDEITPRTRLYYRGKSGLCTSKTKCYDQDKLPWKREAPSLSNLSQHSQCFTMLQLVRYVVLLFTMQGVTRGQVPGPAYKTNKPCQHSNECSGEGEVCWWSFEGCPMGQCQCHPKYTYQDSSGRCVPLKMGEELCNPNDKCPPGMSCQGGRCMCESGFMTDDKTFCLTPKDKMLGETCMPGIDKCYQRKAYHDYTTNDMVCRGTCQCRSGFKEDGGQCRRLNVGESGCSRDHHCQGGALCLDGSCQCPSGYMPAAGGKKCAKLGAKYDLRTGSICDELNERGYCSKDLICHRCAHQNHATCVRYLPSEPHWDGYVSKSSVSVSISLITLVTSLCLAVIYITKSSSFWS